MVKIQKSSLRSIRWFLDSWDRYRDFCLIVLAVLFITIMFGGLDFLFESSHKAMLEEERVKNEKPCFEFQNTPVKDAPLRCINEALKDKK